MRRMAFIIALIGLHFSTSIAQPALTDSTALKNLIDVTADLELQAAVTNYTYDLYLQDGEGRIAEEKFLISLMELVNQEMTYRIKDPKGARQRYFGNLKTMLEELSRFRQRLRAAGDSNSADALGAVFLFVSAANSELDGRDSILPGDRDTALGSLRSMDEVLGLLEVAHASRRVDDDVTSWVEQKIQERADARAAKDFAAADTIRDELQARNIVLEDGAGGTRWKVVG